ncbi:helix-turn-helix domain-containing protein [Rhodococcus opacus]|uniref:helix-turn-helix domain-containing protein n=1 Tax=Rhodococcus opacus TaxID=37919 RepID=UPI002953FB34|nr:MerR family transcriptional regulator [Rhodococcus opacus]
MDDNELYSIGQLAERSGLPVRTIRFYSDEGIMPAIERSPAGYRRYDAQAVARLDLVRTLRDLGLSLPTIRTVLNNDVSLKQVAATHAQALDVQIHTLRLRRAVVRAAAKLDTTPEEMTLMHQLAKMSDAERHRLIQNFLDETFGGLDSNPDFVATMREAMPVLPDDPSPEQVQAWVDLADLVVDHDFRASVRRMAQHLAAERADGDQTGLHHDLTEYIRVTVTRAIGDDIRPSSAKAGPVVDDLVARYAQTFDATDSTVYRKSLVRRLEVANDPRTERYWQLLSTINGWPFPPTLAPVFDWFTQALRAHPTP